MFVPSKPNIGEMNYRVSGQIAGDPNKKAAAAHSKEDERRANEDAKYNAVTNVILKEISKRDIPYEQLNEHIGEIVDVILSNSIYSKIFGLTERVAIINAAKRKINKEKSVEGMEHE